MYIYDVNKRLTKIKEQFKRIGGMPMPQTCARERNGFKPGKEIFERMAMKLDQVLGEDDVRVKVVEHCSEGDLAIREFNYAKSELQCIKNHLKKLPHQNEISKWNLLQIEVALIFINEGQFQDISDDYTSGGGAWAQTFRHCPVDPLQIN